MNTGVFLNITYYDFEVFLSSIELELRPYLNLKTKKLEIPDGCNDDIVYVKTLKVIYDRLYPGLEYVKEQAKSLIEEFNSKE